jgi:hypothetical protein
MKVILRAQLVTDWGEVTEVDVAEFSRPARALNADTLGLSLTSKRLPAPRLKSFVSFTESVGAAIAGIPSKTTGYAKSTPYLARSASGARGSFRAPVSRRVTLNCRLFR